MISSKHDGIHLYSRNRGGVGGWERVAEMIIKQAGMN